MRILPLVILLTALAGSASAVDVVSKGGRMSDTREINADSLLAQADSVFQKRDYQGALDLYTRTSEIARADFNRPVEVEALAQMARMNLLLDTKEEGRHWLQVATERASDSDPMGWSRLLGVKGRFEWKDGDLKTAHATFEEMYTYCNTNALWSRAVDAAHMIAIVSETPEEQIEWGQRGIEAAEAGGVESWLGPLWNNLGTTYYDLKHYDLALECFLKARQYHWQYSDETAKLYADYHVGMTYRFLGKYDEAKQWLRPVLAWAERLENHSAIGQACEDLGEIDIAQGKKTEGVALLKRARTEYQAAGFDKTWPGIWENVNKRLTEVQ